MPKSLRNGLLALSLLLVTGCASMGYYLDVINGHANILNQQRPVVEVLADPATSPELHEALTVMQQAREFASTELQLPRNDSYQYYVDIGREYAAWNVVATPRFDTTPREWCFVFAGCLNYRGFFSEQDARDYATGLQEQELDTYVAGARAYSTLGWFDDPVLSTMLLRSEATRVGIIFHELAHQKQYVADDSAFNEAFAVFVEQEGVQRWFKHKARADLYQAYLQTLQRRKQFNHLLLAARQQLEEIYDRNISPQEKLQGKTEVFKQLKQDYQQLKSDWQGYTGYDAWMQQDLNNAHLALVATYHEHTDRFRRILAYLEGDLGRFYQAVAQLADADKAQRQQWLAGIDRNEFTFLVRRQERRSVD